MQDMKAACGDQGGAWYPVIKISGARNMSVEMYSVLGINEPLFFLREKIWVLETHNGRKGSGPQAPLKGAEEASPTLLGHPF